MCQSRIGKRSRPVVCTRINVDLDVQTLFSLKFLQAVIESLDVLYGKE